MPYWLGSRTPTQAGGFNQRIQHSRCYLLQPNKHVRPTEKNKKNEAQHTFQLHKLSIGSKLRRNLRLKCMCTRSFEAPPFFRLCRRSYFDTSPLSQSAKSENSSDSCSSELVFRYGEASRWHYELHLTSIKCQEKQLGPSSGSISMKFRCTAAATSVRKVPCDVGP